jgi:hypothetical protein
MAAASVKTRCRRLGGFGCETVHCYWLQSYFYLPALLLLKAALRLKAAGAAARLWEEAAVNKDNEVNADPRYRHVRRHGVRMGGSIWVHYRVKKVFG